MESDPPFHEKYKNLFSSFAEKAGNSKAAHENEPVMADECAPPVVDLRWLSAGDMEQKECCKREIAGAANQWGLFQVVNHGIPREILARIKREQVKLFRIPFHKKANDRFPNLPAEYYRWGTPTASSLTQFSWSEAFHIPLENLAKLKLLNSTLSKTIAEFAEATSELAQGIAEILAENLGCSPTFFSKNCLRSSCYLRLNRYPPCPISSQVFGLVPHTDSDFLTILYQDQVGGLQVVKDGRWVNIKPNPDSLIIIIGDLFQAWSNGVYKSMEHRVVSNHRVERFSIGYFLCPSNETVIQPCHQPSIYRKFSFGEYRQQVQQDVIATGGKIGLRRFLTVSRNLSSC
ncbi:gibberellin 2-beta-dioxygenase 8-like isoform X2 [Diospyros lotus]|uniref:gibberellin 2-beta-dioxygenase 8-like isoform X2 n=1 Tax=Diospyros lotus TaxID=55363 RepID=UPI0022574335|nr:gibberellin 2-beta-dioxygenase 8-like isoform X2 [Diospyros lotus]